MKILDVCCGSRMFWYEKHEPHTTYMDIRKQVYTAMDRDTRLARRTWKTGLAVNRKMWK